MRCTTIATVLLLCLPVAGTAQVIPEYFERDVPVVFSGFISCKYLSSATVVLRRAHDVAKTGSFDGFQVSRFDGCTRQAATRNSGTQNQIILRYTLSTFKTTEASGLVSTFYAHAYRRATWPSERLEYMVTDIPMKDTIK